MKLNPLALGLTLGVVAGVAWLVLMVVSLLTGFLDQTLQGLCSLHPRCVYDYGGAIWMAVMHLVAGFVGGYVFGWVYNLFAAPKKEQPQV